MTSSRDNNDTISGANITLINSTLLLVNGSHNSTMASAAEEFYNHYILEVSEGIHEMGGLNWKLVLCLALSWLIVLICLIRGIQSLGKVVYFTAIFPYLMLTILLIRGVTLPGAKDGILFYLTPDFARLKDPRVWSDAATQIFYSLSACTGGLIAMSSYSQFSNNCYRDSLIVALVNCGTSVYSGFVIFSILGFMAYEKGVDVAHVADTGPGLAFVVYPEALSRMPVPQMWSIFFFIMMATLGFGSIFSIMECVLSAISDEFPVLRTKPWSYLYRIGIIFCTFLLGLPMVTKGGFYLLSLVDFSVSGFPLLVVGLLELVALQWVYTFERFSEDIYIMIGYKPNLYWRICWMGLSPLVMIITIATNIFFYTGPDEMDGKMHQGNSYPDWAHTINWLIAFWPMATILAYFLYYYCKHGGFKLFRELQKPSSDWGPALVDNRKGTRYNALEVKEMDEMTFTRDPIFLGGAHYIPRRIELYSASTSALNTRWRSEGSIVPSRKPSFMEERTSECDSRLTVPSAAALDVVCEEGGESGNRVRSCSEEKGDRMRKCSETNNFAQV